MIIYIHRHTYRLYPHTHIQMRKNTKDIIQYNNNNTNTKILTKNNKTNTNVNANANVNKNTHRQLLSK